eukprot:2116128-Amphidinium_carterae.1
MTVNVLPKQHKLKRTVAKIASQQILVFNYSWQAKRTGYNCAKSARAVEVDLDVLDRCVVQ